MPNVLGRPRNAPRMPEPGEKWCPKCSQFKPLDEFGDRSEAYKPGNPARKAAWCKLCFRAYYKKYNQRRLLDPSRNIDLNKRLRVRVINHYGGKCVGCEATDIDVLCIDHKDPALAKRQKENGLPHASKQLYRQIVQDNFPDDYQVLCRNCNWKKKVRPTEVTF